MHLSGMRRAVIVGKGPVSLANGIDDEGVAAFVMADRFSVPGRFDIGRMRHVQVDMAHLRPVLHDDHNLIWQLIDEKWRANDVGIKSRNTGWPATFMSTVGYAAGEHLVVRFFHRRFHPVLQNRIGEIGDAVGWNRAAGRRVRVGFSKVTGPGPPPGAAIRSSTPKVRSSCQPVESSGAKIGMAEFRTASAAKAAPVVDKKAIKHVKLNLDMFPLRTELRFLTRINLLRRRFNQPRRGSALFKKPRSRSGGRSSREAGIKAE